MTNKNDRDVLEHNVSTLLESGGEAPRLADAARARMRSQLIAKHAAEPTRSPLMSLRAIGVGLAAAAVAAVVVTRVVGDDPATPDGKTVALADGSSWIVEGASTVTVLGDRHVRVEGAALLDIAPGTKVFRVDTAQGTIEVLGTRFLVDASAARTTAAVVRGKVKLASASGEVTLHAGEQAIAEAGKAPVRGPAPRLSHLVSWAAQARRESQTARPLRSGTLFARDPGVRGNGQFGEEQPLPLVKLGVDIVVENQVARVALDQTFHNPSDRVLEGVYKFAVPADAALQRLAMYVDGTLTESAVVERMRARRIYEELVYRRVDPALLEWEGTGKVSLRVYPLPARQDKRIVLAYTQSLAKLYEDWTITVPLPEIDAPVGEVAIDVAVRGCANCELTSPSHAITVTRKGDDATVTYRKTAETLGDSLVLRVRDTRKTARAVLDDQYLMVRAPAQLPQTTREYRPRTWVILDDVSASRGAMERAAQSELVDAFVRELDEDDRVAVVAFDVATRTKLPLTRVMDVDRAALRRALADEGDVGATDMAAALTSATTLLAGALPDDAMVVYLGDGVITTGSTKLDQLRTQLVGRARFVGVGVGDGADTQTLEALAAATGGYATTIDLADDLGWRAFDLVAALHTTRITGVSARLVDASGQLVPATVYTRSPQLADGEEIEVVAKLAGAGTPVAVELVGANGQWTQRISLADATRDGGYLPRLWAQRHLAARMLAKHEPVLVPPCVAKEPCKTEQQVREERDEAIRKEVVELGKEYFLLSRHTSLIVLENDAMYAKYGVRKGAGDTWAPYALPAKLPITASVARPADVTDSAEVIREPLQIFSTAVAMDLSGTLGNDGVPSLGMAGLGRGGGGSIRTRADLGITPDPVSGLEQPFFLEAEADERKQIFAGKRAVAAKSARVAISGELQQQRVRDRVFSSELRGGPRKPIRQKGQWAGPLYPQRLTQPLDPGFDDLSTLVPALFPDTSDVLRAELVPAVKTSLDPAAAQLLTRARAALPSGVYHWGELTIAVDGQRRYGWKRTTDAGVAETAAVDGSAYTRRYPELGISVSRAIADDDIALALAYLPVWIAAPEHYAKYFTVQLAGANAITLATQRDGKPATAFTLTFDAAARLVSIADRTGAQIVTVTWGPTGPIAATVQGRAISVSFTAETIADAVSWAHGAAAAPSVAITLPTHMVAYAKAQVAPLELGSPAWRAAQRQVLASAAATADVVNLQEALASLRSNGGLELGDLVLGSSALVTLADPVFAQATQPLASEPVVRYLAASRALRKTQKLDAAPTSGGPIAALWQLRHVVALFAANKTEAAVTQLLAIAPLEYRLIAAAQLSLYMYSTKPADIVRAWESVAVGRYVNVARSNAVQQLYSRAAYELAATMLATLVEKLDLAAEPPFVNQGSYVLSASRRGPAGWAVLWATWRDRVLASGNFAHVQALLPVARQTDTDVSRVIERLVQLAGTDVQQLQEVAQIALDAGQGRLAQTLVDRLVRTHGTPELHAMAGQFALQQHRTAEALAQFEAAQQAGADEAVDINTVRRELSQLVSVAGRLAVESSGAARADAAKRAMEWGARWRAIDPANSTIDRQLGELQLQLGNADEAWRQLSGTFEREPTSSVGYIAVAEAFERQGRVSEALDLWQQAIVIDQTNPIPRLRKAQALFALGRTADAEALLEQIARGTWHDMWSSTVYQAKDLLARGKPDYRGY